MTFPRPRSTSRRRAFCLFAAFAAVSAARCSPAAAPIGQARTLRIGTQNSAEALSVLADILAADRLISIDLHGRPSLRLASDYRWLNEGRTLQLSLRTGVQFHDGTPMTPAVIAEILRQRVGKGGFEFVTRVEPADGGVVLIQLSRPDAFLIDALAGTPIVEIQNSDIGTGPFKLLAREPAIRAERNVNYYRGMPGVEQVQVTMYDTPRSAWSAMMRGEVDMVTEVNRDSVEFMQGATRFVTYSSVRPYYIPLVFNMRHPILRNVEVRRALAEAIDRDEILRRAMRGHGQIAEDPLWPSNWAYTPATRRHSFDPGAAAARLDAAGLAVRHDAQPGAMPSRFQIRCMFWNRDPQYERIALMLQRQLATVGVDLVPEPLEQAILESRIQSGEFDTYIYRLGSGKSFDTTYLLWHADANGTGRKQNVGYSGANDALDRLRAARGDSEVRVAVADLRERFYQDVPAAFIAWLEATRAVDSTFDVGDASDPEILANLWRWSVAKPEQRAAR